MKYYHYFDDLNQEVGNYLNTPEGWDVLREKGKGINSYFFIPEEREAWQQKALADQELTLRARSIVDFIKDKFQSLHSVGVGNAHLEYLLKLYNPAMKLTCSDFAPKGIERLKQVFKEANRVFAFDMFKRDWRDVNGEDLYLFYRVDTVFDDNQWADVLAKMSQAGIKNILFIPSEILTLPRILKLKIKYFIFALLRKRVTFSGFVRTQKRFITLLSGSYQVKQILRFHDLTGFLISLN